MIGIRDKKTKEEVTAQSWSEGFYVEVSTQKVFELDNDYYDGLNATEMEHLEVFIKEEK